MARSEGRRKLSNLHFKVKGRHFNVKGRHLNLRFFNNRLSSLLKERVREGIREHVKLYHTLF